MDISDEMSSGHVSVVWSQNLHIFEQVHQTMNYLELVGNIIGLIFKYIKQQFMYILLMGF